MKVYSNIKRLKSKLENQQKKKIVFTNGVFDIIHPGHIELFQFAKKHGDILIIGINDDHSVKRLKGKKRPVYPLKERIEILETIEYIDYIVPFSEDTPLQLIQKLNQIDILVKGGDYSPGEVVGRKEVKESGGELLLFDFKSKISSTSIINKIISQ